MIDYNGAEAQEGAAIPTLGTIEHGSYYIIQGYDLPIWYAFHCGGSMWLLEPEDYRLLRADGDVLVLCDSSSQPVCYSGVKVGDLVLYDPEAAAEAAYINAVAAELLESVDMGTFVDGRPQSGVPRKV